MKHLLTIGNIHEQVYVDDELKDRAEFLHLINSGIIRIPCIGTRYLDMSGKKCPTTSRTR